MKTVHSFKLDITPVDNIQLKVYCRLVEQFGAGHVVCDMSE